MFLESGAISNVYNLLFLYSTLCILWFIIFIIMLVIVKDYLNNK